MPNHHQHQHNLQNSESYAHHSHSHSPDHSPTGLGTDLVKQESSTPEPGHPDHSNRYDPGPSPSSAQPLNYQFGNAFGQTGQHQPYPAPAPAPAGPAPLPPANYRFGGPSSALGGPGNDGPSYFDYSMRRHSLTNAGGLPPPGQAPGQAPAPAGPATQAFPSPQRLPSIDAGAGAGASLASPGGGHLKRKTSGQEETIMEDGAYYGGQGQQHAQGHGPAHQQGAGAGGPGYPAMPYNKRRGSSLTYDKMGSLSLSEQHRRDSMMSGSVGMSSWEEERRGSNGSAATSFTTNGSPGYAMGSYSMAQQQQQQHQHQQQSHGVEYDQRGSPLSAGGSYGPPPGIPHRHSHSHSNDQSLYDHQRVPMGPPPHPHQIPEDPYGRRHSGNINGTSQYNQQGQGQGQHYQGPHDRSVPPPIMVPAASQASQDEPHSAIISPDSAHGSSQGQFRASPGYANLPPAQAAWARAGPLPLGLGGPRGSIPGGRPGGPSRQGSGSSLDPSSAYGLGQQIPNKDTPYSRSPELRVSHKLAERKRRKEMAQLFDDLRDALPVNRGLKSSKWEILSKAVDYIDRLKEHNRMLGEDNAMLRQHFGLGPGPQAPEGLDGEGPEGEGGEGQEEVGEGKQEGAGEGGRRESSNEGGAVGSAGHGEEEDELDG